MSGRVIKHGVTFLVGPRSVGLRRVPRPGVLIFAAGLAAGSSLTSPKLLNIPPLEFAGGLV